MNDVLMQLFQAERELIRFDSTIVDSLLALQNFESVHYMCLEAS